MDSLILQQLEQLCEAPLPAEYLQRLQCYPQALQSANRADDGSDAEGTAADVEFLISHREILNINLEVRGCSILDPEGQEFRWPDQLLVIGETGDGDYYCVDTDGEHEGVLQFRHYAVEFEVIADSLDDFVEMLMQAFVERSTTGDDTEDDDDGELPDAPDEKTSE